MTQATFLTNEEFNGDKIRKEWHKGEWHYSVIDIIAELLEMDYKRAQNYWKVLKHRLKAEGNETPTKCCQLKLLTTDGKMYLTDVVDKKSSIEIVDILKRVSYHRMKRIAKRTDEIVHIHPIVFAYLASVGWATIQHVDLPSGKTIDILAQRGGNEIIVECKKELRGSQLYGAIGQVLCYTVEYGKSARPVLACPVGCIDEYAYHICRTLEIEVIEVPIKEFQIERIPGCVVNSS